MTDFHLLLWDVPKSFVSIVYLTYLQGRSFVTSLDLPSTVPRFFFLDNCHLRAKAHRPEEDALLGVRHDDHFCLPSVWARRRNLTLW